MSDATTDPDTYASRIVETIREPLLLLDADFRVVRANPSFCRTFGTPVEDVEGEPLDGLADGRWDIPELFRRLDRVLEEEEPLEEFELERTFPGIGRRVVRLYGRLLERERGESRMILLAIEDVTERLELQAELRRHARELERSNADLEQFA